MQPGRASESQRVLIHAPYGRDGELIQHELQTAGFSATVCASVEDLCSLLCDGAGAVLIGDEALVPATVGRLAEQLAVQPPWSDFPLLVMTSGGASTSASRYRLRILEPLGNVTLLERPLRPVTLISTLRAALRARRHQYQLREYVRRIESSEQALRQSEARFRFLSELGEATRFVAKPHDVTATVAQRLGEHLQVSRCAYATVDADSEEFTILHDYTAPGCSSTVGVYRWSSFGKQVVAGVLAGQTLVIRDLDRDLPGDEARAMFVSLGIQAIICCPLIKEGRPVAMMAVHQTVSRDWTSDDVDLVEEVAERCWAYIERERLLAELAQNNEALQRSNQDLRRANRELEEFAYVAGHDLQEPLRMVKIYTQLILKRLGNADAQLTQYGDLVRQGAGRMEDLIRDVLSYSRAVHSEAPMIGTADLSASLAEAISVLEHRIEESGALIRHQWLPVVRGDTPQLAHVFQNLISNSIKYCRPGETPVIDVSAEGKDNEWILSLRDNGIGFEQRYAERIFGLFKRLHKDEYPGTGLGLAICQRIIERYGGRMWAISSPGEGSTFYFSLPSAEAPANVVKSPDHDALLMVSTRNKSEEE